MNRIDLTNLGGFPLEQDTLKFMQDNYTGALGAIAKLCGDKTILYGVETVGGNVTDGWISYNGELIKFVGGLAGADVIISETAVAKTFEDGTDYNVYFTKIATCGTGGEFPFADLVPLLSLVNIWQPGDVKEVVRDASYIAANYDADGYGLNREKGWRIMSKAYVNSAGKVFVNLDPADSQLNTVGFYGGEKTHTLTTAEMPSHSHAITGSDTNDFGGAGKVPAVGGGSAEGAGSTQSTGGGGAHNNMQPYFVILKLIKL